MAANTILLHPATRVLGVALGLAAATHFFWLIWSGGSAGYGTWLIYLAVIGYDYALVRAKSRTGS